MTIESLELSFTRAAQRVVDFDIDGRERYPQMTDASAEMTREAMVQTAREHAVRLQAARDELGLSVATQVQVEEVAA